MSRASEASRSLSAAPPCVVGRFIPLVGARIVLVYGRNHVSDALGHIAGALVGFVGPPNSLVSPRISWVGALASLFGTLRPWLPSSAGWVQTLRPLFAPLAGWFGTLRPFFPRLAGGDRAVRAFRGASRGRVHALGGEGRRLRGGVCPRNLRARRLSLEAQSLSRGLAGGCCGGDRGFCGFTRGIGEAERRTRGSFAPAPSPTERVTF